MNQSRCPQEATATCLSLAEDVNNLETVSRLLSSPETEEGDEMVNSQHYCLRWNNYQSNMTSVFHHLLRTQAFVDVTLACNDQSLKAHKVVLSACSSYFQKLLLENPCKHPTIIMPQDVCFTDLKFIIEFVYKGEIDVSQAELQSLLKTADQLKIKGLCEVPDGKEGAEVTPLPHNTSRRGLSLRQRRLATAKRRLQYRERLNHSNQSNLSQMDCMDVGTVMEDSKELPSLVVVDPSQASLADQGMILASSPRQLMQPSHNNIQQSQVPVENGGNDENMAEMGRVPTPPSTLVPTLEIQQSETHRDVAVDSSDLGVVDNNVKVKFETLRAIEQDPLDMEQITDQTVQTNDDDHGMHTMMITPELLGLIPSSNSDGSEAGSTNAKNGIGCSSTKTWTQEDMGAALDALRNQTMSLSKASLHFGIPSTTLWQRAHRLGIDTPKKDGPTKSWSEDSLNTALDALRTGSISANKASKAYGIPSSTLYKIARREGIRLAAPFNAVPTAWVPEDLERALEAIRSGQFTVQRAATEFGIPSGTLYGRCKREGIELSRNNPTPWSEDAMLDALEAVRNGQMSINQAAIHYNLPYSSLYGRFKRCKYEAEGLSSGGEMENDQPMIHQQQQSQTQQPQTQSQAQSQPQAQPPQAQTQQPQAQPQIMLVQYQQPLQMYQSAT
ncbi:protein tramtrack, beta isoform-like isoform X1 [Cimex lectularius]|uniref:Pipsqueak n=1 Tax=Cimex lectularius TaxID=79782 RepID=A0A8I6RSX0_CIMLE|nr:protein tramtrack, beta isoform-like isoform X1 [Cimex lectularius]